MEPSIPGILSKQADIGTEDLMLFNFPKSHKSNKGEIVTPFYRLVQRSISQIHRESFLRLLTYAGNTFSMEV